MYEKVSISPKKPKIREIHSLLRFNATAALNDEVRSLRQNLSSLLINGSDPVTAASVMEAYNEKKRQLENIPEEVGWDPQKS